MVKRTPPPLDNDQKEAILMLRYHTAKPCHNAGSYMKVTRIAEMLNLPMT